MMFFKQPKTTEIIPQGNYVVQRKYDGERMQFIDRGNTGTLLNRRGANKNRMFPEFNTLAKQLPGKNIIDGEMVVFKSGIDSFKGLAERTHLRYGIQEAQKQSPATYMAFDLLKYKGQDIRQEPLKERLKELHSLPQSARFKIVTTYPKAKARQIMANKKAEGVVFKDPASLYTNTKNNDWLKLKQRREADAVVMGYNKGEGKRATSIGSLQLGVWNGKEIVHVGNAGSFKGYTNSEVKQLKHKLDAGKRVFVKVGYLKKGSNGKLVEPKVLGERTDIGIKDTHTSSIADLQSKNMAWNKELHKNLSWGGRGVPEKVNKYIEARKILKQNVDFLKKENISIIYKGKPEGPFKSEKPFYASIRIKTNDLDIEDPKVHSLFDELKKLSSGEVAYGDVDQIEYKFVLPRDKPKEPTLKKIDPEGRNSIVEEIIERKINDPLIRGEQPENKDYNIEFIPIENKEEIKNNEHQQEKEKGKDLQSKDLNKLQQARVNKLPIYYINPNDILYDRPGSISFKGNVAIVGRKGQYNPALGVDKSVVNLLYNTFKRYPQLITEVEKNPEANLFITKEFGQYPNQSHGHYFPPEGKEGAMVIAKVTPQFYSPGRQPAREYMLPLTIGHEYGHHKQWKEQRYGTAKKREALPYYERPLEFEAHQHGVELTKEPKTYPQLYADYELSSYPTFYKPVYDIDKPFEEARKTEEEKIRNKLTENIQASMKQLFDEESKNYIYLSKTYNKSKKAPITGTAMHVEFNNPEDIYLDNMKLAESHPIERTADIVAHEEMHNILNKEVGVEASRKYDDITYRIRFGAGNLSVPTQDAIPNLSAISGHRFGKLINKSMKEGKSINPFTNMLREREKKRAEERVRRDIKVDRYVAGMDAVNPDEESENNLPDWGDIKSSKRIGIRFENDNGKDRKVWTHEPYHIPLKRAPFVTIYHGTDAANEIIKEGIIPGKTTYPPDKVLVSFTTDKHIALGFPYTKTGINYTGMVKTVLPQSKYIEGKKLFLKEGEPAEFEARREPGAPPLIAQHHDYEREVAINYHIPPEKIGIVPAKEAYRGFHMKPEHYLAHINEYGDMNPDELEDVMPEEKIQTYFENQDRSKNSNVKYRSPERGQRVKALAYKIQKLIQPYSSRVTVAGSIRREITPNDIDMVVIPRNKDKIIEQLSRLGYFKAQGEKQIFARIDGVDVDIYFTTPQSYGAELMTRTGPRGGNLGNRTLAKRKGYTLNQYGLYKGDRQIAGRTEKEIYEALGKKYKPPQIRGLGAKTERDYYAKDSVPISEAKYVTLYHGTQKKFVPAIMKEGLRGYTYFSPQVSVAMEYAEKQKKLEKKETKSHDEPAMIKTTIPVNSEIQSQLASKTGKIWSVRVPTYVPPEYLSVISRPELEKMNILTHSIKQNLPRDKEDILYGMKWLDNSKDSQIYLDKTYKQKAKKGFDSMTYFNTRLPGRIFIGGALNNLNINEKNIDAIGQVIGHEELHNILQKEINPESSHSLDVIALPSVLIPFNKKVDIMNTTTGEIVFPSEYEKKVGELRQLKEQKLEELNKDSVSKNSGATLKTMLQRRIYQNNNYRFWPLKPMWNVVIPQDMKQKVKEDIKKSLMQRIEYEEQVKRMKLENDTGKDYDTNEPYKIHLKTNIYINDSNIR